MVYRLKEDSVLVPFARKPNTEIPWDKFWFSQGTYLIFHSELTPGSTLVLLLTPQGDLVFTSMDRLEIVR